MKILKAKILDDGVNMSISYEEDGEIGFLVISLENIIKNHVLAQKLKELFILQDGN